MGRPARYEDLSKRIIRGSVVVHVSSGESAERGTTHMLFLNEEIFNVLEFGWGCCPL